MCVEGSAMDWAIIKSIRVLPSDKGTFPTEQEFKVFIQNTVLSRGGYYYFPGSMMNCPKNTLVLFQYAGMIRATGVLIDLAKEKKIDERGLEYAGYYKFDVDTVVISGSVSIIMRYWIKHVWGRLLILKNDRQIPHQ